MTASELPGALRRTSILLSASHLHERSTARSWMAQSTQQPGSSKSASSPTQKLKASPKPHPISSPASSSRPMSNHAPVERPALSKEKKGEHKRRKRKSKAARAAQLKELESDQATPVPTNEEWPSIPLTEADSVHPAVFSRDSRYASPLA